jgi:hypothetical protein
MTQVPDYQAICIWALQEAKIDLISVKGYYSEN